MSGPCPCGTGLAYAACCEPLHDGPATAATAERLMRSRYAAYARKRTDYVFRTWHPRTRPARFSGAPGGGTQRGVWGVVALPATGVEPEPGLVWTGLRVLEVSAGEPDDSEGTVEFEASYDSPAGPGVLHERSRFVRRGERWVYVDGEAPERRRG